MITDVVAFQGSVVHSTTVWTTRVGTCFLEAAKSGDVVRGHRFVPVRNEHFFLKCSNRTSVIRPVKTGGLNSRNARVM